MKMLMLLAISLSTVVAILLAEAIDFDNLAVGAPPAGWTATKTGTGNATWSVEASAGL